MTEFFRQFLRLNGKSVIGIIKWLDYLLLLPGIQLTEFLFEGSSGFGDSCWDVGVNEWKLEHSMRWLCP